MADICWFWKMVRETHRKRAPSFRNAWDLMVLTCPIGGDSGSRCSGRHIAGNRAAHGEARRGGTHYYAADRQAIERIWGTCCGCRIKSTGVMVSQRAKHWSNIRPSLPLKHISHDHFKSYFSHSIQTLCVVWFCPCKKICLKLALPASSKLGLLAPSEGNPHFGWLLPAPDSPFQAYFHFWSTSCLGPTFSWE